MRREHQLRSKNCLLHSLSVSSASEPSAGTVAPTSSPAVIAASPVTASASITSAASTAITTTASGSTAPTMGAPADVATSLTHPAARPMAQ